jgi:long-chain acyl-CoA synthetase
MREPAERVDALPRRAALATPGAIALRTATRAMTFADLDRAVDRLAAALRGAVGRPRGTVALAADLDPSFAIAYYAAIRAGHVVAIINPFLREEALRGLLEMAGVRLVIGSAPFAARLPAGTTIDELLSLGTGEPRASRAPDPGSAAVIQFTSGTTSGPKAVLLTHRNVVVNARQVAAAHRLCQGTVTLNHLPTYHPMHLNAALLARAEQVLCTDEDAAEAVRLANEHRATHYYSLPVRLARLAADPRLPGFQLSTVRCILSGGSALSPAAARQLGNHFGLPVLQGYGLAEMSPLTHCDDIEHPTIGAVGRPVEDTECRVVDPQTREPLPAGGKGEIQVRGPQMMQAYLDPLEDTGIGADGWLSTGDIGHEDADRTLYVTDRLKDVFKCDGWMVAPSDIEAVLARHPDVADCCVVDEPDDVRGGVPCAFVTTRQAGVCAADLIAFVNRQVQDHEQLRRAFVIDRIPRSPNGKVLRRELRDQLTADSDQLTAYKGNEDAAMVTVINRLTVHGDRAAFERIISGITEYMRQQPGFASHRLYRSRNQDNVYIETAEWTDAALHRQAMQGIGFRDRVRELGAVAKAEPDVFDTIEHETAAHA